MVGVPAPGLTAVTNAVKVRVCPNAALRVEEMSEVVLAAWPTLTAVAPEALGSKVESPLYAAVMECEPTGKNATAKLARPPLRAAEPNRTPPSTNETVPVGVPLAELTVAMRLTGWPKTAWFTEDARTVELGVVPVGGELISATKATSSLLTAEEFCD
jgi:hypothetical protein